MTEFAFRLYPDRIRVLMDTLSVRLDEKDVRYASKPKIVEDKGIIIFGRGMTPVLQKMEEKASAAPGEDFDQFHQYIAEVVHQAIADFVKETVDVDAFDQDIDGIIELFKEYEWGWKVLNSEVFFAGFSKSYGKMRIALVRTYNSYEPETIDGNMFMSCGMGQEIEKFFGQLMRWPESDRELLQAFRASHRDFENKSSDVRKWPKGGGDVEMVTLYADGSSEKKTLGPVEPPKQESAKQGKVGRNEPCPCGSGKKYKKCCGK